MDDLDKETKTKIEAWDIIWPSLIWLDAMNQLPSGKVGENMKKAIDHYNNLRNEDESV